MAKPKSRPVRWMSAAGDLREAFDKLQEAFDDHTSAINDALTELTDLQGEYEEWMNSMHENLQGSATYGKLEEIVEQLDIPDEITWENVDEVREFADLADQIELPQGFGRD